MSRAFDSCSENAGRVSDHKRQVRTITWIGLFVNLLLAGLKFAAGLLGSSQAVVADAVHSVSDMSTDLAVLLGVRFWSSPADESHPYGHQRIETLITVSIGIFLAVVAFGIGYHGLTAIPRESVRQPGWPAFAAVIISIVVKEALYRATVLVGGKAKSAAVIANAWHHRSDALSSIPAALAAGVASLNPELTFVDQVGAVIVSLFILHAAFSIIWPPLMDLAGRGASARETSQLQELAAHVPEVRSVHAIRSRRMGSSLFVDLHILVDGDMTVREGHEVSEQVKRRLIEGGPEVVDVVVHTEPDDRGHPRNDAG